MKAEQLTYGVEIECGIRPDNIGPFEGGPYHHGERIALPEFRGWRCERDGSLQSQSHAMREIVSPVLHGERGLRRIATAVAYMEANGFIANSTCGLHVNVGLPGGEAWQRSQQVALMQWFYRLEEGLYTLMGTSADRRKESTYAAPAKNWRAKASWDLDKYQSLNFAHCSEGGRRARVEFRLFAGRINVDYVIDAVLLSVGLTAFALTTTVVPLNEQLGAADAVEMLTRRVLGKRDEAEGIYPYLVVPTASAADTITDLRELAAQRGTPVGGVA